MAPGTPSGTLPAFADGDATGGSTGGNQSCLSVLGSGVGVASATIFGFGVPRGVGDGLASASFRLSGSSETFPFSSSSSVPTRRDEVSPTSFNAAKTDAPRTVTSVPPLVTQFFRMETPPVPNELKYRPGAPSGMIRTLYFESVDGRAFAIVSAVKSILYRFNVHHIEPYEV